MGYDPKRPRPAAPVESQVDALIEPVAHVAEPLAVVRPAAEAPIESPTPAPERASTPVVPAPAEGTANRAVVAAVAAAVAALLAVVVLLRRRRRT